MALESRRKIEGLRTLWQGDQAWRAARGCGWLPWQQDDQNDRSLGFFLLKGGGKVYTRNSWSSRWHLSIQNGCWEPVCFWAKHEYGEEFRNTNLGKNNRQSYYNNTWYVVFVEISILMVCKKGLQKNLQKICKWLAILVEGHERFPKRYNTWG